MRPVSVMLTRGSSAPAPPSTPHAYWRINVTASQSSTYAAIAEVEFRATIGGADQCSGGTASASSYYSAGYEADKAFDNNAATLWVSSSGLPQWVAYAFAAAVTVAQIAIQSAPSAGYGTHTDDPKDFDIQYSDDGISWTTSTTVTGQTGWAYGEVRTFSVP